jgi:hypothetical protein
MAHYSLPAFMELKSPWLEVVDGRGITEMGVSAEEQRTLASVAESMSQALKGGRVAMVAVDDLSYGVFRMWELQREGLGYSVHVFRDFTEARAWVTARTVPQ